MRCSGRRLRCALLRAITAGVTIGLLLLVLLRLFCWRQRGRRGCLTAPLLLRRLLLLLGLLPCRLLLLLAAAAVILQPVERGGLRLP